MRRTRSGVVSLLSFAVLSSLWACDSSTGTKAKSIALSLSATSLSLSQGGTAQIAVTIQRNNFEEAVVLSVDGPLPEGVTASFSPSTLPGGATSAVLNVTAAGNAAPTTSAAFLVRAAGQGVTEQSQAVTVTVAITGTYTLGLFEPSLRIAQGGGGDALVLVTRSGGNAGDVFVSISGLPSGITASVPGSPTTAAATSAFFTAAPGVAIGTYPVTITSSSPGMPGDQSIQLSLEVIAPLPTAAATVRPFCAAATWFAFKNEGFPWQQVTSSTGTSYTFQATDRVILAYVLTGQQQLVIIDYVSRAELDAMATAKCGGERDLSGSVAGLSAGQVAFVAMGTSFDVPDASALGYALNQMEAEPLDLIATRGVVSQTTQGAFLVPDRSIIRRAVDAASGSTLSELNFTGAESFPLGSINLSVAGIVSGRLWNFQSLLRTATTSTGLLHSGNPVGTTATLYVVPAEQRVASDVHEFLVHAYQSGRTAGEIVLQYAASPSDRVVNVGPLLATPAVTTLTAAPYARYRGRLPVQNEYASMVQFTYAQTLLTGNRTVIVAMTSGYLGSVPASEWNVVVPDLSGASGFDPNWMLASEAASDYLAESFSTTALIYRGSATDGDSYASAYYQAALTSSSRLVFVHPDAISPFLSSHATIAPLRRTQYLRR